MGILSRSLFHSQLFGAHSSCFKLEEGCGRGRKEPVRQFDPNPLNSSIHFELQNAVCRREVWEEENLGRGYRKVIASE